MATAEGEPNEAPSTALLCKGKHGLQYLHRDRRPKALMLIQTSLAASISSRTAMSSLQFETSTAEHYTAKARGKPPHCLEKTKTKRKTKKQDLIRTTFGEMLAHHPPTAPPSLTGSSLFLNVQRPLIAQSMISSSNPSLSPSRKRRTSAGRAALSSSSVERWPCSGSARSSPGTRTWRSRSSRCGCPRPTRQNRRAEAAGEAMAAGEREEEKSTNKKKQRV